MNNFDLILILVLIIGLINGFFTGFIKTISGFVGIGIAIWVGINFSNLLEVYLVQQEILPQSIVRFTAFILTIILVIVAIKLLAKVLHTVVHTIGLGIFNRIAGAFTGVALYALSLSAFLYYLFPILSKMVEPETIESSQILPYLLEFVEMLKITLG